MGNVFSVWLWSMVMLYVMWSFPFPFSISSFRVYRSVLCLRFLVFLGLDYTAIRIVPLLFFLSSSAILVRCMLS